VHALSWPAQHQEDFDVPQGPQEADPVIDQGPKKSSFQCFDGFSKSYFYFDSLSCLFSN
jgi:hypothetical protein